MWCIPPLECAYFVASMEEVLDLYCLAYDPAFPVVCMDEQPEQLLGETRTPIIDSTGRKLTDHEYVREGNCNVWMFNEPPPGRKPRLAERTREPALDRGGLGLAGA